MTQTPDQGPIRQSFFRATAADEWRQLAGEIRMFFSGAEAAADTVPDFGTFCAAQTLLFCRFALLSISVMVIAWAPFDFLFLTHDAAGRNSSLRTRLIMLALSLAAYAILGRASKWKRGRLSLVVAVYLTLVGGGTWLVGETAGPDVPMAFNTAYAPVATVFFLLPPRPRIAVNIAAYLVVLVAYFGLHRSYFQHQNAASNASTLAGFVLVSIVAGHWVYRQARASFQQRRQALEDAARLKEVDRLKDSFIATVSHELRTPLNTIIGLTEVVMEERDAARLPRYARTIHDSGEMLLGLINDILDLAKVRSGRLELEPEPMSLSALVERATDIFGVECQRKDLRLTWSVSAELPAIMTDAQRLNQIIVNLVGNAVKFTDSGGVRVEVGPEGPSEAMRFTIRVSDTGLGIPADKRELIFEEFTQLSLPSVRRKGGTGLGLPIVMKLARLMGGDVTVRANEPRGSVFEVSLPYVAAPPPMATAPEVTPVPRPAPTGKTLRILIADDVLENRLLMQLYLENEACEVVLAEDGVSAVERFRTEAFHLVLVDIEMPEMDGYQAVDRMRAFERDRGGPTTPIVAVTAHGAPEVRRGGFTRFLHKPLRKKALLDLLDEYRRSASLKARRDSGERQSVPLSQEAMQLRGTYLKRKRDELASAKIWLESSELEKLRGLGHQWSGTSDMFGDKEMADIGRQLEQAAKDGDRKVLGTLLLEAEQALRRSSPASGERQAVVQR